MSNLIYEADGRGGWLVAVADDTPSLSRMAAWFFGVALKYAYRITALAMVAAATYWRATGEIGEGAWLAGLALGCAVAVVELVRSRWVRSIEATSKTLN